MKNTLDLEIMGSISHAKACQRQEQIRQGILEKTDVPTLLIVEHPPTITLGRGEKGQNLHQSIEFLKDHGFDVEPVNRGGMVTYHGPGQLVVYPIVDLQKLKLGIKDYIKNLETVMIDTLAHYGITADRMLGQPGVYVNKKKIGSVGIHVRKFVSIHGFALNVCPDLTHFGYFTPCGIQNMTVTSIQDQGQTSSIEQCTDVLIPIFQSVFDCDLIPKRLLEKNAI